MSASTPTYDAYQQVFGLSMLANRAGGYTGSQVQLQQQLQYDLSYYLNGVPAVPGMTAPNPSPMATATAALGNWQLVWGPALLEHVDKNNQPSGVADNAVYVAYNESVAFPGGSTLPAYVVAIAATNPISKFDWLVEDFDVSSVVEWATYNPANIVAATNVPVATGTPMISMGTAIGVGKLLTKMPSPSGAAAPGTTLQQFLATLKPTSPTAIVFTGHSLAGALSPTLALYLQQQGALASFSPVLVYPTAGATPGNANVLGLNGFVAEFNQAFPALPTGWTAQSGPYQHWNTDLWNVYDVIPHAWGLLNLQEIPTLYGSPALKTVSALAAAAAVNAAASKVNYVRIRNAPLQGSLQDVILLNPDTNKSKSINVPPTTIDDFLMQLLLQHVSLYSGIPADTTSDPQIPEVQGLILSQPLPQPSPSIPLVSGVAKLTEEKMIADLIKWVADWIKKHS